MGLTCVCGRTGKEEVLRTVRETPEEVLRIDVHDLTPDQMREHDALVAKVGCKIFILACCEGFKNDSGWPFISQTEVARRGKAAKSAPLRGEGLESSVNALRAKFGSGSLDSDRKSQDGKRPKDGWDSPWAQPVGEL